MHPNPEEYIRHFVVLVPIEGSVGVFYASTMNVRTRNAVVQGASRTVPASGLYNVSMATEYQVPN